MWIYQLFGHTLELYEEVKEHPNSYKVYENQEQSKYSVCGVHLHVLKNRGQAEGKHVFNYCNGSLYEMECDDESTTGTAKKYQLHPTQPKKRDK